MWTPQPLLRHHNSGMLQLPFFSILCRNGLLVFVPPPLLHVFQFLVWRVFPTFPLFPFFRFTSSQPQRVPPARVCVFFIKVIERTHLFCGAFPLLVGHVFHPLKAFCASFPPPILYVFSVFLTFCVQTVELANGGTLLPMDSIQANFFFSLFLLCSSCVFEGFPLDLLTHLFIVAFPGLRIGERLHPLFFRVVLFFIFL